MSIIKTILDTPPISIACFCSRQVSFIRRLYKIIFDNIFWSMTNYKCNILYTFISHHNIYILQSLYFKIRYWRRTIDLGPHVKAVVSGDVLFSIHFTTCSCQIFFFDFLCRNAFSFMSHQWSGVVFLDWPWLFWEWHKHRSPDII